MSDLPAVAGGQPVFESRINIVRPVLPAFEQLDEPTREILSTGMVTKGRHLARFEQAVASHLGVRHAVGVSSCTTGLMLTYRGLGLEGGEVIVPSFTFMATVSALVWAGARPVFVDCGEETANVDLAAVEAAVTPATRALVAVHVFGNPADIQGLEELAARHGLKLVFDAAHGFGSLYRGQPVGRQGTAHVFSLSPTKLLIAGEGGIVATDSDELAEYVRLGREYGNDGRYDSAFAGMNARLAEFNAIMGLASLNLLEEAAVRRNASVERFRQRLEGVPGLGFQRVDGEDRCSYKDFSITVRAERFGMSRDELSRALAAENIDTRHYYDPPCHRQKAYAGFDRGPGLPVTDRLAAESLSLPLWSRMPDEVVDGICRALERLHAYASVRT